MINFNENDGGRQLAGSANDCATRALVILTGADYRQTWDYFAMRNWRRGKRRSADHGVPNDVIDEAYGLAGLYKLTLPRKMSFAEVAKQWPNCIVDLPTHVACIRDGELHDTWNCAATRKGRERKVQAIWIVHDENARLPVVKLNDEPKPKPKRARRANRIYSVRVEGFRGRREFSTAPQMRDYVTFLLSDSYHIRQVDVYVGTTHDWRYDLDRPSTLNTTQEVHDRYNLNVSQLARIQRSNEDVDFRQLEAVRNCGRYGA